MINTSDQSKLNCGLLFAETSGAIDALSLLFRRLAHTGFLIGASLSDFIFLRVRGEDTVVGELLLSTRSVLFLIFAESILGMITSHGESHSLVGTIDHEED